MQSTTTSKFRCGQMVICQAVVISKEGCALKEFDIPTDDEVLILCLYSGLNYKDALAMTATAPICRFLPCVAGIEVVGRVLSSKSSSFETGDLVMSFGQGAGEWCHGGLATRACLPATALMKVPFPGPLDSAALRAAFCGVAGITAAFCVDLVEPALDSSLPVLVTGASGGVGTIAIKILTDRGIAVTALTRSPDKLKRLFPSINTLNPDDLRICKALEKPRFSAAIDNLGGDWIGTICSSVQPRGVVVSVGNIKGNTSSVSVLPFILRGISLIGAAAQRCTAAERERHAAMLVKHIDINFVSIASHLVDLAEAPVAAARIMSSNANSARTIVKMQSANI